MTGWRYVMNRESGGMSPAYVRRVTAAGIAHFVKPNPWALRPGDKRAGWTKEQTAKETDIAVGVVPGDEVIARIVAAIGPVPGEVPG